MEHHAIIVVCCCAPKTHQQLPVVPSKGVGGCRSGGSSWLMIRRAWDFLIQLRQIPPAPGRLSSIKAPFPFFLPFFFVGLRLAVVN